MAIQFEKIYGGKMFFNISLPGFKLNSGFTIQEGKISSSWNYFQIF